MLLMIQVHIMELFASDVIFNSRLGKASLFLGGSPVAPVFVLILGYFIAASQKNTKQLILRGMQLICLGLLLNIVLNFNLILSVYKGLFKIDLWHYIFGVDILPFAGISIILLAVLKKTLEKSLVFTIVCIGVSAFFGQFLLNYIPGNTVLKYVSALFYGSVEWSYFPLFPWIIYPLAGFGFYQLKQKTDLKFLNTLAMKVVFGVLFAVFLVFTIRYAVSVSHNLQLYYHQDYVFTLWVLAFLAFYGFFVNETDKFLGNTVLFKYLKWLGKNVTVIYVIQWIIIGNTATEIYKTVSSPLYLLFWFFGILLVTSGVGYGVVRVGEKRG